MNPHQFVCREDGQVITEELFGDQIVRFLYSETREKAPALFQMLTGERASDLLGLLNFDLPLSATFSGSQRFLKARGVDLEESLISANEMKTPRDFFERKICYWKSRPMPEDSEVVVSPADSRMIVGGLSEVSYLKIKDKFFKLNELLGTDRTDLHTIFHEGDFAIFRLTPEMYHWNHVPVSGVVRDIYTLDGDYHSCNPGAVVKMVTPYSANRRVVTIIDTDVPHGSWVGRVAMVEIVALMIGGIDQRYSQQKYDSPTDVVPRMFLKKGQPKSLYRPGSSTDVLIFEPGRLEFDQDLVSFRSRSDVQSRFNAFGGHLNETEVKVRQSIARKIGEKGRS